MTAAQVAMLTPAGTGAIATLAVIGPGAWEAVRSRFRPANGKPLPAEPAPNRFWYGSLGDGPGDEVVVAVKRAEPEPWVEVHCHGGRQVVRWLVEQFQQSGCAEAPWNELTKPRDGRPGVLDERALEPLTQAPTLRTALILLDQYHGAFARAVAVALAELDRDATSTTLDNLARYAPVGRQLVRPWRVAVAGAPNVGKSSLINALAGYHRSIVAPIAGTTRDVVTVPVALDGWAVELADTAGLWESAGGLDAEGIGRARATLRDADLVLWVIDSTAPAPLWPDRSVTAQLLIVVNKIDLPPAWERRPDIPVLPISAAAGTGLSALVNAVVSALVPDPPPPGVAVPFTPELADRIGQARRLLTSGEVAAVRTTLAACLTGCQTVPRPGGASRSVAPRPRE